MQLMEKPSFSLNSDWTTVLQFVSFYMSETIGQSNILKLTTENKLKTLLCFCFCWIYYGIPLVVETLS